MSVNRMGALTAKAALAGFAVAAVTAVSAPAQAITTWNLWMAFDPTRTVAVPEAGKHYAGPAAGTPWGITTSTVGMGHITFDETMYPADGVSGCGQLAQSQDPGCGPKEYPDLQFEWTFKNTSVGDVTSPRDNDWRYNASTNDYHYISLPPFPEQVRGSFMAYSAFDGTTIRGPNHQGWLTAAGNPTDQTSDAAYAVILGVGQIQIVNLSTQKLVLQASLCTDGLPNGAPGSSNLAACTAADPSAVVPIPAALPLFVSGLAAMGAAGWRRRKRAA